MTSIHVGAKVRVIGIPPNLVDDDEFATKSLFMACLGEVFTVQSLERGLAALDVGEKLGAPPWRHTVYVEPRFLEILPIDR